MYDCRGKYMKLLRDSLYVSNDKPFIEKCKCNRMNSNHSFGFDHSLANDFRESRTDI